MSALRDLSTQFEFSIDSISQNDPVNPKFTPESLATYQVILFGYNDGVDELVTGDTRTHFEEYVNNGGGFIPIHAASGFIEGWPWMDEALVQKFYGPWGTNQPRANILHDSDGTRENSETAGIFKGLTEPLAFLDAFYSFKKSPRGVDSVNILLTVDESSFNKSVEGPMGPDHPVAWTKRMGKGRVAHISLGFSWSHNNVYAANDGYLTQFLYGAMRYAAGDFIGCTDRAFSEYNPDATKSDPTACQTPSPIRIKLQQGRGGIAQIVRSASTKTIDIQITAKGNHQVTLLRVSGQVIESRPGNGPSEYTFNSPAQPGLYWIKVVAGGKVLTQRVTVM
jgi:type 1 glutamine amidotransferase